MKQLPQKSYRVEGWGIFSIANFWEGKLKPLGFFFRSLGASFRVDAIHGSLTTLKGKT